MALDKNKIAQIEMRSEYFQDILDKVPPGITTYGGLGIMIVFVLLCVGLRFVKYPDVVTASVIITTETPPIEVYSKTSGRIAYLFRKDQDKVNAGDWIIVLNNSADYRSIQQTISTLRKIDSASFWQSVNSLDFPDLTNLGDLQEPYSLFIKNIDEYRLFVKTNYQSAQIAINGQRGENLSSLKQQLNNQLGLALRQSELAKYDYDRNELLQKESVVTKWDLEQKEITLLNSKTKLEDIKSNLINAQLQLQVLEKDNTTLQNDRNTSLLNLRRSILQSYNKLLYSISEWRNKYVLEAPVSGTLNLFESRSTDQYLTAEQKIFTISPDKNGSYFAIAKLPVSNAGKVRKGQRCMIKVTDYPYTEFGILQGNIGSITAAAKEGFYTVKVNLPAQLMTSLHKSLMSSGELSGETDIVLEDMTLFDRIFKSLLNKNY